MRRTIISGFALLVGVVLILQREYPLSYFSNNYEEITPTTVLYSKQPRNTTRVYRDICHPTTHSSLPHVSVIVVFNNETYQILKRTIFSVLKETPAKLLTEIILVDDFSECQIHFGKLLLNTKLRYYRLTRRAGVMKARNLGVRLATADVVVFLDSHVECRPGWLEPLLRVLTVGGREAVASPVVDILDEETLKSTAVRLALGRLEWSLEFFWEELANQDMTEPFETPAISGGLFAIWRSFFLEIGGFDSEMKVWGRENADISIRVWLCGGQLLIVPCSRVGHIFRTHVQHSFDRSDSDSTRSIEHQTLLDPQMILAMNAKRVSESLLGEYREQFYHALPLARALLMPVTSRRAPGHCARFSHYVEEVDGRLGSRLNQLKAVAVLHDAAQFLLVSRGEDDLLRCAEVVMDQVLLTTQCHQMWLYRENSLRMHGRCLTLTENVISLEKCNPRSCQDISVSSDGTISYTGGVFVSEAFNGTTEAVPTNLKILIV